MDRLSKLQDKAKYRNPDGLQNPSQVLKRLIPHYQKGMGAKAIGQHLGTEENRSRSFNVFVDGIRYYLSG